MINGSRLKQAREAQGLTQSELGKRVDLQQKIISYLEMGSLEVDNDMVVRIANALEVPVAFLFRHPIELPEGSLGLFRSLTSKVKGSEYKASRRLAEIGVESILRMIQGQALRDCRLSVLKGVSDPETAARHVRTMLRLPPEEPIENLTLALERAGVLMLRLSHISEHITGFSAWIDPVPGLLSDERPLIVTRRPMTAFRLRFTLGHECGHLILGHQVFGGPQQPVERAANQFAQALLMPEDAALEELSAEKLTLGRLAQLKGKWGMSMHALAMRAKHLGVIDDAGYRTIRENLRLKGYLQVEPGDSTSIPEQPQLLRQLISRRALAESAYDLADELQIGLNHAEALLGPDETNILQAIRQ